MTQQPKKAIGKAASPLKKAVPKSSVGTKRIGKRSGGGNSGEGEENSISAPAFCFSGALGGLHTAIYIGARDEASTPDHILGANRGNYFVYQPGVSLGQCDSYRPPDACNMDQLNQHATGCAQYPVNA